MADGALGARLRETDERIAAAAREAQRDPSSLTRIVVTKFHPPELVRELVSLGVRDVGESRAQELASKTEALRGEVDPVWHFIGQLQRNKAKVVRAAAGVVHSVDREALVDALAADDAEPLDVFLQLDLSGEPGRGGAAPDEVEPLAERMLAAAPGIRLLGVMAVAPIGEEPRRAFARVRAASERLLTLAPAASAISTGMSQDFREAILEGATHLRIGTAITGKRPDRT